MAIGLALILGFRLKMNFNSPYKATSTSEFWKRWHISLSSWFQEYLYIPLGGNRNGTIGSYMAISILLLFLVLLSGKLILILVFLYLAVLLLILSYFFKGVRQKINTNINLMVTMLLGGLWHGSSWLFIIWGGLNGIGLIIHKAWEKISPFKNNETVLVKIVLMLVTLTFISFTRIFFRSSDMRIVLTIFDRIKNHLEFDFLVQIISAYKFVFALILFGYIIHWIPERIKASYRNWFSKQNYFVMGILAIIAVFLMYQIMSGDMQPFIYFQF